MPRECQPGKLKISSLTVFAMKSSPKPTLALLSLLAAALVIGMLAIFLVTGIGQDPLQFVHPPAEYAALLLKNPPVLRTVIGLDNLFLVVYGAIFVLLAHQLWEDRGARVLLAVALPLLVATGLLDMVENMHFLAMLAGAQQGHLPSDAQIAGQAVESMLKFHVSYLGLLLLGLALPRQTRAQRALGGMMCFVQWPVGVAIYVVPHALAVPLVFVRFAFFLAAFVLTAWIFGNTTRGPQPQGSGVAQVH